jgi:hypothetical protein
VEKTQQVVILNNVMMYTGKEFIHLPASVAIFNTPTTIQRIFSYLGELCESFDVSIYWKTNIYANSKLILHYTLPDAFPLIGPLRI